MSSDSRMIITQEEYLELKEVAGHLSIAQRLDKIEMGATSEKEEIIIFKRADDK